MWSCGRVAGSLSRDTVNGKHCVKLIIIIIVIIIIIINK